MNATRNAMKPCRYKAKLFTAAVAAVGITHIFEVERMTVVV